MSTRETLERDVVRPVVDGLKGSPFKRRGNRFVMDAEHCVGVINIQSTTFPWAPGRAYATAELGVRFRPLETWRDEPRITSPSIVDCHLRCRLGRLLPSGNDYWWRLGSDPYEEPLPEIAGGDPRGLIDAVIAVGVPQLEEFMRPDRAIDWWTGMHDSLLGEELSLTYAAVVATSMPGGERMWPIVLARIRSATSLDPGTREQLEHLGAT